MARYARRPLAPLLELMQSRRTARFMPAWSFPHGLGALHHQQEVTGGGYKSYDDGLRFSYEMPVLLCSPHDQPAGVLMALMDETTSWASIGADQHRRPGVSVHLSLELSDAAPVEAGERLLFTSHVQKLGRAMGFIACEVRLAHCASPTHRMLSGHPQPGPWRSDGRSRARRRARWSRWAATSSSWRWGWRGG